MSIRDTSGQDRVVASAPAEVRNRKLRQRLLVTAGGGTVVLLAAWLIIGWGAGARSLDASRVRIAEVKRGDLVRDISADGRVIAANNPTLYAIAGGTVTLKVVAGDAVKKDQPLAEIDSPELRSKLAQEQATLAGLEAEVSRAGLDAQLSRANARKLFDQAQIDRQSALRDLERNQRAFDGGAVAQIDVARAQDNLKKADIGLAHARGDLGLQSEGAGLDTRNKRLLADRQRAVVAELQRQVDALTLRAPFDGQVGQVMAAQRANVAVNAPVLSVVDLKVFEVEIKVPESFARDLAIGMPAQLTGSSGTFAAQLSAISPEVVGGEVTGRLRFKGKQPSALRQNQRLSARILLDTRRNVLMVERGPFLEQSGGNSAYVMDGNSAVKRAIRTGVSSLDAVEILEGLQAGDRVVVSGADGFGDAERIRISGE
ncbi:HlyD family efflux transporter periplasmic adaptor subunit [Lysobacter sp. CFH 32150]|uniref:efflux RND transporter periplasmic adaptor subunit n=1 Tax=Lysobacter sp. CFH 32150 TaxID=2927128 RepID=UPI001FA6C06E|nr:HlyD family efflux transporter periplasmic adaptor subunit [Lysobacter sp. CFH 32150]MCI4568375.1 HlyD family efflux transporter periplasmic adaptor subunit [Lysobacter sp. CFH 32150]